ncbi:unnamed protein product [Cunninghamella blakesleeana]
MPTIAFDFLGTRVYMKFEFIVKTKTNAYSFELKKSLLLSFIIIHLIDTLTHFDNIVDIIWQLWETHGLKNKQHAYSLFNEWYETSYTTYLAKSHLGIYKSFIQILHGSLKRIIYKQLQFIPTDKEMNLIIDQFKHLIPSFTSLEALELALNSNWTVWIITQLDKENTYSFLKNYGFYTNDKMDDYPISNNINNSSNKGPVYIMSCDQLMLAKPHPKVYAEVMRETIKRTQKIENFYYISSRSWDLASAKNVSMKTAFVKSEELMFTTDIYDGRKPDLEGETVIECVQKILNLESSLKHYYLL